MELERQELLDLAELGDTLLQWFISRNWEVRTFKGAHLYSIQAKKTNPVRKFFCANRALVVQCSHDGGRTRVRIGQGSWSDNIWGNVIWFAATGGTNLLFSLWGFEVQREFKNYVKQALNNCHVMTRMAA